MKQPCKQGQHLVLLFKQELLGLELFSAHIQLFLQGPDAAVLFPVDNFLFWQKLPGRILDKEVSR